jgi:hypothetical protein
MVYISTTIDIYFWIFLLFIIYITARDISFALFLDKYRTKIKKKTIPFIYPSAVYYIFCKEGNDNQKMRKRKREMKILLLLFLILFILSFILLNMRRSFTIL